MKVKISGIQLNTICWVGSGGGGLSFICTHMVTPMMAGQMPICMKPPISGNTVGSNGISPNSVKKLVGSRGGKSLNQAENGGGRILIVIDRTLESEKNTGIWIAIGRQPAIGLIFSFLYSSIIACCCFILSSA